MSEGLAEIPLDFLDINLSVHNQVIQWIQYYSVTKVRLQWNSRDHLPLLFHISKHPEMISLIERITKVLMCPKRWFCILFQTVRFRTRAGRFGWKVHENGVTCFSENCISSWKLYSHNTQSQHSLTTSMYTFLTVNQNLHPEFAWYVCPLFYNQQCNCISSVWITAVQAISPNSHELIWKYNWCFWIGQLIELLKLLEASATWWKLCCPRLTHVSQGLPKPPRCSQLQVGEMVFS